MLILTLALFALSGCAPSPAVNVLGYELEKRLGAIPPPPLSDARGRLRGQVIDSQGRPVPNVTALVATRYGTPFTGITDAQGIYTIENVPPGLYAPAFVHPAYEESTLQDWLGIPGLVRVHADHVTHAPTVALTLYIPPALPAPLPQAVQLAGADEYVAYANFPPDSQARAIAYRFTHGGVELNNLRLYLPLEVGAANGSDRYPLLFMIYPTDTRAWEEVSVGFAAQGYAFVAVSPVGAHGLDIDAHAQDARLAFELALGGHLHPQIDGSRVVALGGSFSSAILHRFLRAESDRVDAWVNVGGISNALTGAAEFYRGELDMPPEFELAIPALGPANVYPLPFLRYSPVYTAGYLPPTFIVHTEADRIATIDQARQLEAALIAAGVPVETFYYQDDSHYLMIGDYITQASIDVYYRILDYIQAQLAPQLP